MSLKNQINNEVIPNLISEISYQRNYPGRSPDYIDIGIYDVSCLGFIFLYKILDNICYPLFWIDIVTGDYFACNDDMSISDKKVGSIKKGITPNKRSRVHELSFVYIPDKNKIISWEEFSS